MSNSETLIQNTQHAFLVAWGWFAQYLGLIQQLQAVSLKQKHYHHRPQTKVLEFLVAILAGLPHLQDYNGPRNLDTKRGENKIDSRHDEKTV